VIALEMGARLPGAVDVPIYDADNVVGYVPAPNPSGSFLNRNDWVVNDRGMGGAQPWQDGPDDVLLVGDSIVWCGNSCALRDRLGPRVQEALEGEGKTVWPISAGSWAVVNEANWLEANRDVLEAAETLVFVFNSGDFDAPSSWQSPLTHPRARPLSAVLYLVQKRLIRPEAAPTPVDLRVPMRDPVAALADVVAGCDCDVQVWLYPTRAELADPDVAFTALDAGFAPFAEALGDRIALYRVGQIPGWRAALYRDPIHPTPDGTALLARAIAAALPCGGQP